MRSPCFVASSGKRDGTKESPSETLLGRGRREGKALVMLQVMLGNRGSTPVPINLLVVRLKMGRSGIKGGSLSKRPGWKRGAGRRGRYEPAGARGLNSARGRHRASPLCSPGREARVRCLGEGFGRGVPGAPSSRSGAPLHPSPTEDGAALMPAGAGCSEGLREVAVLTTIWDFLFFFVAEGAAAWAVTLVRALMLRECLREEMTTANCGVAGAGGEAEIELLFIVLGKCFLALKGPERVGTCNPSSLSCFCC